MARRNLCPNPAAKNNVTGYAGTATPARVTGLSGFPRTTGVQATATGYITTPVATCSPGDQIVVSLWASNTIPLGSKTIYAAFTRTAGGDDFSQTFTISVGATPTRATFTATAPANSTGVYLLLDGVGSGVNCSAIMYEPGTVDSGYADGDTASWTWDGTNGNSSSTEVTGTNIATSGTLTATSSLSSSISSIRAVVGTLGATSHLSGISSGGDTLSGANYDLNEILDAIAALFNGVPTGDTIGGVQITLEAHSEVAGSIDPPAVVLELDDQNWALDMGDGADQFQVTALVLVTYADAEGAQRLLRSWLSRKPGSGIVRLRSVLEADQTLGGLVSYAIMTGPRNIGEVTYQGIQYLGVELIIEVMST